jgi:hypothetical protein
MAFPEVTWSNLLPSYQHPATSSLLAVGEEEVEALRIAASVTHPYLFWNPLPPQSKWQ